MAGIHRKQFDPSAHGAVDGVRVVDLSRLVAGNVLTKVFPDHGAEVVKVEPPEGDTLRAPRIGEHNDDILVPILGGGEVVRLRGLGVVRNAAARKAAE